MQEMQIFNSPEFHNIRTIEIDSKPYVVGVDVARALEYANPSKAVIDHCKGDFLTWEVIDSMGRTQNTRIIPEGGIYRLIIKAADQSRNLEIQEKAKRFEHFIFDEVLPSIRKTGSYCITQQTQLPQTYLDALKALVASEEAKEQLMLENRQKEDTIVVLQPKADYADKILSGEGLLTITQIAKDYGMSGAAMNKLLKGLEVQYQQNGQWLLYSQYQDKGYAHSVPVDFTRTNGSIDTKQNLKWTQAGKMFLYDLLKRKFNIVPTIEQVRSTENSKKAEETELKPYNAETADEEYKRLYG